MVILVLFLMKTFVFEGLGGLGCWSEGIYREIVMVGWLKGFVSGFT